MIASTPGKLQWRLAVPAALLLVLAACTSGFDGRYAALNHSGEISTDYEGNPDTVLTVDGDSASLMIMGDTEVLRAIVVDDKLHLTPLNDSSDAIILRKEGKHLVTEGPGRENRLVRI